MPLNREPLPLTPDPASVRKAREWVADIFAGLGREDLVDSAELGVSELVTNAILHGEPPITLRVRGTRTHPRVEVHDRSPVPPEVNVEMADEDHLLSTIGRGLGIVALYSSTWGSEVTPEGKTVWFEPTAELRTDGNLSGQVFDFTDPDDAPLDEPPQDGQVTVRLIGLPVAPFLVLLNRYRELRRELRLLALSHSDDYPVARQLSEVTDEVAREMRRAFGARQVQEAHAAGRDRVDLEYRVPATAPALMGRLLEALEQADAFCREQRLLTIAASPQQQALQRWYLGEFTRQAAGEDPTPWQGSLEVVPRSAVSSSAMDDTDSGSTPTGS